MFFFYSKIAAYPFEREKVHDFQKKKKKMVMLYLTWLQFPEENLKHFFCLSQVGVF